MTNPQQDTDVIETAVLMAQPPPAATSLTLFRSDDPASIITHATEIADALTGVLREKNLITTIGNREHVRVEGWTLCGSLIGVFPVLVWSRPLADGDGFEARVEARTITGAVVGAAEAECRYDEANWGGRDAFALRSMAQTRATSKALRQPLGFIVAMAGYNVTPAEEMDGGTHPSPQAQTVEQTNRAAQDRTRQADYPERARCPDHGMDRIRVTTPKGGPYRGQEVFKCSHKSSAGTWCNYEVTVDDPEPEPTLPQPPDDNHAAPPTASEQAVMAEADQLASQQADTEQRDPAVRAGATRPAMPAPRPRKAASKKKATPTQEVEGQAMHYYEAERNRLHLNNAMVSLITDKTDDGFPLVIKWCKANPTAGDSYAQRIDQLLKAVVAQQAADATMPSDG